MQRKPFGQTRDGQAVEAITLDNGQLSCTFLTYGATLVSLNVPDPAGKMVDVALGYDTLEAYESQDKYLGATVGRYANRIAAGRFTLDGVEYTLVVNDGDNHLHGGPTGFSTRVWQAEEVPGGVCFTYESQDMEEGFPGALTAKVTYTLEDSALVAHYQATTDRPTVCNLTNHTYFNLNGHNSGSILDHVLVLHAAHYTPVVPGSIPTGKIEEVIGTPMDFLYPHTIGQRIERPFPQLQRCGGYDHNWVIDGPMGTLRPAARLVGDKTGIALEVETTLPGVQCYAANFLEGCPTGKGGVTYHNREGVCLETQFYPDSPNHPSFPSCVLRPGEVWDHTTVFRFSK